MFDVPDTEDHNNLPTTENPEKLVYSDTLSILFGNVDGLSKKKADKLKILSDQDHFLCLNELNYKECDASLLVNSGLGNLACIKALDDITFKKGKRISTNKNGIKRTKKKGYGTAIISKLSDGVSLHKYSEKEEIVYATLNLHNTSGLIITGYRSPSSRQNDDIKNFYLAIESVIIEASRDNDFDFLLFVGDDNSYRIKNRHYAWLAATEMEQLAHKYQMVNLISDTPTRGKLQPDSCYGFFDPDKIDISAHVMDQSDSDHRYISISITRTNIVAEPPKFKKMLHRKQVVSKEKLSETLQNGVDAWLERWESIPLSRCTEKLQNKAVRSFNEVLLKVQNSCFKKKYRKVERNARKQDDDINLNVLRLRAQISKFAWQIKKRNGINIEARRKLLNANSELRRIIQKAAIKNFQDDIHKQSRFERLDDSNFWKITNSLLNKGAYQTAIGSESSHHETLQKLDKLDKTFQSPCQDIDSQMNEYKNIVPDKQFKLYENTDEIEQLISDIPNLKNFVKKNNKVIAPVFSKIFRIMNHTKLFPECCNTTRCSIIGLPPKDRAIFALSAIPKIIETGVKTSFDNIKTEDGTMQMAYTANRGAVSCNGITLQEVEMCEEQSIQTQQDLEKAFNKTHRPTVLNQMQRKYGAGSLIASWFKNRTYTFNGPLGEMIRGENHSAGVPAGTLLGVESFLVFISTCTSLTAKNTILLWAALYADDTSPLIKGSDTLEFQKALTWSMKWARENGCSFHLSGSKAPTYLAYLKKGQPFCTSFDELKLGECSIKRVNEAVILGLYRRVRAPVQDESLSSSNKIIDKHGYVLEWNITKLKQIAYRLQNIRLQILPVFMKKLVDAYFCGYVRFSASLIWCRSDQKHKDTARFYYCMALSSILGLTTLEALNLACCKHQSVKCDNKYYRKLLLETGLPSLEQMACRDAVTAQKQMSVLKPHWYRFGTSRQQKLHSGNDSLVVGVTKKGTGTLIHDLYDLTTKYKESYLPTIQKRNKSRNKIIEAYKQKIILAGEDKKETNRLFLERKEALIEYDGAYLKRYETAKQACTKRGRTNYTHLFRTFSLSSRLEFDCLDTIDRVSNFKTPIKHVPVNSGSRITLSNTTCKQSRIRCQQSLACDIWSGDSVYCSFCNKRLETVRLRKKVKFESHLLFDCPGIPMSVPLPDKKWPGSKDIMKRLAAIGAAPDPGGY